MLQRIQTVYLTITFILTLLLFFVPMGGFQVIKDVAHDFSYTAIGLTEEYSSNLDGTGVVADVVEHSWALMILVILILVVNVIGIGLYKNRIFQMRFNSLNIFLNLGVYALFFLFAWSSSQKIGDVSVSYGIAIIFPIVNMILTYLAIRAIGKDEALVRSLDRIR